VATSGSKALTITTSGSHALVLSGAGGSVTYTATVTVAATPPPVATGCDSAAIGASYYALGVLAGKALVHVPDSAGGYILGFAAGKLQGSAAVKLDSVHAQIYLSNGTIVKE
jgi:hypothetical protein